jgi:hypothetical protein
MGLFDEAKAALLQAMREELERRVLEEAGRIFETERTGPGPAFSERDFGRWGGKVRGRPGEDAADAFGLWTAAMDEGVRFNHAGPFTEGIREAPSRSDSSSLKESRKEPHRNAARLFASKGYRAVSEEPEVAVAATQLRAELAEERAAFWKVGSDNRLVYHSTDWLMAGGPDRIAAAHGKLRRRVKRVLQRQIGEAEGAAAERALW